MTEQDIIDALEELAKRIENNDTPPDLSDQLRRISAAMGELDMAN